MTDMHKTRVTVYCVLGEASGDNLAADLAPALINHGAQLGKDVRIVGLAGPKLQSQGVQSLFDINNIAVMGISAVVGRLPTIIKRVRQTVRDILEKRPDCILLIDSPEFCQAVAKRVRKKWPDVPVIKYICPSVWAWRPGRAKKMTSYIDHVLAILPFEPKVLKDLGGPDATYIGHPLARQIAALPTSETKPEAAPPILLVLPGSRMGEVSRLLPPFGEALSLLKQRGVAFEAVIPAVPHLKSYISERTRDWDARPQIVDSGDNDIHFSGARAAMAASGTVSLQLALHHVPMHLAYILDPAAHAVRHLIKAWSVALPNLIVDWPLVPEDVNDSVRAGRLARSIDRLLANTPERAAQLAGFEQMTKAMETDIAPADKASEVIFDVLAQKRA